MRGDKRGPERITARIKTDIVIRAIRGESSDSLARENGIATQDIEEWRKQFTEAGESAIAGSRAWRNIRRAAAFVFVALVAAILTALGGLAPPTIKRLLERRRIPAVASVDPGGRVVSVRDSTDSPIGICNLPDSLAEYTLKDALVFARPHRDRTWILAWTDFNTKTRRAYLVAWNRKLEHCWCLPSLRTGPFGDAAELTDFRGQVGKQGDILPDRADEFMLAEGTSFYGSVLRVWSFADIVKDEEAPREVFRYYHAGQISDFYSGLAPAWCGKNRRLMWIVGISNSTCLCQAAGTLPAKAFFLAGVEASDGASVLGSPLWRRRQITVPDNWGNLVRTPEIVYFLFPWFVVRDHAIRWNEAVRDIKLGISPRENVSDDSLQVTLTTNQDLGLRLTFEPRPRVAIESFANGNLQDLLVERAQRLGVPFDSAGKPLFADTLVNLVGSAEDLAAWWGVFRDRKATADSLCGH